MRTSGTWALAMVKESRAPRNHVAPRRTFGRLWMPQRTARSCSGLGSRALVRGPRTLEEGERTGEDHWIVEPVTVGLLVVIQKMPGYPCVSNLPLVFIESVEFWMTRLPEPSLLTKKMAPPPSVAELLVMLTPQRVRV